MTPESHPLTWTQPAQDALDAFLARRLTPEKLEGADPAEVREDLTAHLHEELHRAGVQTVTRESLHRALGTLGEPVPEAAATDRSSAPSFLPGGQPWAKPPEIPRRPGTFRRPRGYLFWTVALPLFTYLFEVATRWCSEGFFNPLPGLPHHLLVLLVPAAGWLIHRVVTRQQSARRAAAVSWIAGGAAAAALFYSLLFAPLLPYALIGLIAWGLGLLCWAPVAGFFGLLCGLKVLREYRTRAGSTAKRPAIRGFVTGLILITALELPPAITEVALAQVCAAPESPAVRARAAALIRNRGSATALLNACYEQNGRVFTGTGVAGPAAFVAGWFAASRPRWDLRMDDAAAIPARDLYFRVTGMPFNAATPPAPVRGLFVPGGRGPIDTARGGTRVAGIIDGLSLAGSRLDWHGESATGLSWSEWTLTFANTGPEPHEARCLIALPPGGFVSRVTLWVNGEMQEAAYSSTGQVRAAYQKVAVQQRRDPVLVTQIQPGSVMLQAFPVPSHGELKTRITITSPPGGGEPYWLPAITEKNFAMPGEAPHALWAQADGGTLSAPGEINGHSTAGQGPPVLTATLQADALSGNGTFLHWQPQPAPLVWCEDVNAPDPSRLVIYRRGAPAAPAPRPVAVVLDSSAGLRPHLPELRRALAAIQAQTTEFTVLIPGDTPADTASGIETAGRDRTFAGGRDNTAALRAALDWLRGRDRGLLLWIHGPQPLSRTATQELEQVLDRTPGTLTLCDLPVVPGENTISPLFNARPRIHCDALRFRPGTLVDSLKTLLTQPGPDPAGFTLLPAGSPLPEDAVKVTGTLARWRIREEAFRLAPENPAAAGQLAAKHQIITPWSGAVVLERASDYKASGLEQSSRKVAQEIPVIPEPSTSLLCAGALLILNRRRRPAAGILP